MFLVDWIYSIARGPLYLKRGEVLPHQESASKYNSKFGLYSLDRSDRSDPVSILSEAITLSSELQLRRSTYAFWSSRRELHNGEVQFTFWQSHLDRSDRFVHTGLTGLHSLLISVVISHLNINFGRGGHLRVSGAWGKIVFSYSVNTILTELWWKWQWRDKSHSLW